MGPASPFQLLNALARLARAEEVAAEEG